ncbi:MAG: lysophospholipid acyltransferase family protein [Patescibacteria group bacterium]
MVFIITQYLGAGLSWLLLKIFTNFEIRGLKNLKEITRPFVVVTNHESHLDPQLVGVALFHRPSLFPLRYMAKNELFRVPVLNFLIWILGAFKAHRKTGIGKSLLTPTRILEKGGGVIMFPEGRIIKDRPRIGEGRRGAAILALTTKALLVPMSLHTPPNYTFFAFLFKRKRIIINIGQPFYLNNLDYPDFSDENTYKATAVIMQKIGDLYRQHDYAITDKRLGERRGS